MNASTMRVWVDKYVWQHNKRVCEEAVPPVDRKKAVGTLHIDAYSVHLAQGFCE